MTKIQAGVRYTATSAGPLALLGNDTVALWAVGQTLITAAPWAGGNSITGGNGSYTLLLTGGHDTVSVG